MEDVATRIKGGILFGERMIPLLYSFCNLYTGGAEWQYLNNGKLLEHWLAFVQKSVYQSFNYFHIV